MAKSTKTKEQLAQEAQEQNAADIRRAIDWLNKPMKRRAFPAPHKEYLSQMCTNLELLASQYAPKPAEEVDNSTTQLAIQGHPDKV